MTAEEKILDEVKARLGNVTKANGYTMERLRKIERGRLTPFKPGDIPAANYYVTRHSVEDTEYGDDDHYLRLTIDVRDTTRDNPFPDMAAQMTADVVTAMHRTTTAPKVTDLYDHDFAGTITRVRFVDGVPQVGEGQKPWVGVVLEFEIRYTSDAGDMFNHRP